MQGDQAARQNVSGPPQLPSLYTGQKIRTGPYSVTVTDDMVAQRERENQELYRAWREQQQRRAMGPNGDETDYMGDFKHQEVRRSFIRKVFVILTLQLLFTAGVIAVFLFVDAARKFMILYWWIWIIAFVCFIISYCAVSCSTHARRTPPLNYILLCKLTLALSYLAAFASVSYEIEIIFMALGMTAAITFGIGLLATFTKFDLTMRTGLMMIVGLASMLGIVVMTIVLIFTYIRILHIVISVIGMIMLSMVNMKQIFPINDKQYFVLTPMKHYFLLISTYILVFIL